MLADCPAMARVCPWVAPGSAVVSTSINRGVSAENSGSLRLSAATRSHTGFGSLSLWITVRASSLIALLPAGFQAYLWRAILPDLREKNSIWLVASSGVNCIFKPSDPAAKTSCAAVGSIQILNSAVVFVENGGSGKTGKLPGTKTAPPIISKISILSIID